MFPALLWGQPSAQEMRTLTGPLLNRAEVKPGETVPRNLRVYTELGEEKSLLDVIDGKYTVLVSGCLTCPIFHRTYPGVEAVYQDYKDRDDIQFFYLYKTLAHPEYQGYIQPATLEERLAHIPEVKRVLDTRFAWLCDSMDNAVRHTLGLGPNSQMIFSPEGEIVHALGWSNGEVLREELVKRVGDTDTHTSVSDLNLNRQQSAMAVKTVQQGRSDGPVFDETLIPLQIAAKGDGKHPFYVKPRIEVTQSVLQQGRGAMYLGFHLDPIHHVHWNNLAAPLQYELLLPDGVHMNPRRGAAEEVEVESDADPREFVIEITSANPGERFELSFRYFACSDEEGWCVPVTQSYEVALAADVDGGGVMGRSFNRGGGRQNNAQAGRAQRRGAGGGRQPMTADQLKERILQSDTDGDGKITKDELPAQMQQRFERMDQNGDGVLDEDEIEAMANRFRRGGGQQRRQPAGGGRDRI